MNHTIQTWDWLPRNKLGQVTQAIAFLINLEVVFLTVKVLLQRHWRDTHNTVNLCKWECELLVTCFHHQGVTYRHGCWYADGKGGSLAQNGADTHVTTQGLDIALYNVQTDTTARNLGHLCSGTETRMEDKL